MGPRYREDKSGARRCDQRLRASREPLVTIRDRTKHKAMPGDPAPARPNRTPTQESHTRSRETLDSGPCCRLGPPRTRLRKEHLRRSADDARAHPLLPLVQSRVARRGIGDVRLRPDNRVGIPISVSFTAKVKIFITSVSPYPKR